VYADEFCERTSFAAGEIDKNLTSTQRLGENPPNDRVNNEVRFAKS